MLLKLIQISFKKQKEKHQKSNRMDKNCKQKWIQHGAQLEPNFAARIWPNILKEMPQRG